MFGLTGDQLQLITGIVLTVLGVIAYTNKRVDGVLWNTLALLVTGTGIFMLIQTVPTSTVYKSLLYITLFIALSVMVIRMDGQLSTLVGVLLVGAFCYVFWINAPSSWTSWVEYVWGKFLAFGQTGLSLLGFDL